MSLVLKTQTVQLSASYIRVTHIYMLLDAAIATASAQLIIHCSHKHSTNCARSIKLLFLDARILRVCLSFCRLCRSNKKESKARV